MRAEQGLTHFEEAQMGFGLTFACKGNTLPILYVSSLSRPWTLLARQGMVM